MKPYWMTLPVLLLACAGGTWYTRQGEGRLYGRNGNGFVWVRGPWPEIQPSHDVDEVIDQLCPAIMRLPNADKGDLGQEYCGVIYSLNGVFHASYGSPLGKTVVVGVARRKQCTPPRSVVDERGRTSILADYHSHPWAASQMSRDDRMASNQRWFIRIQFDTDCHIMKVIPFLSEPRPGEVYIRDKKAWKLIAYIRPEDKEDGIMTAVDDG